jgi:hypothetical protein
MIMKFSDCQCHRVKLVDPGYVEIYQLTARCRRAYRHPAIEKRSPAEIRFEGCARRLIKI